MTTTLRGVWACSPQNVYAVGDRGVLLRTRNGGTTWERMTNPVGGGEFRDVRMFRDSVGVAVGRIQTEDGVRGLILHTSNGGTTWKNYQPPSGMTLPLLNCLAASQDRTLFMESGNNAMTLLAAGAKITGAISNIMISYDYGNLWKSYGTGTLNELNGIGWSNILSCYVGNSKSISEDEKYASQNSTGNLIQSKLFPNIVTENLRSAHGNPGTFYGLTIVGENGFLIETFKGVGWYTIPSGTSETLNGIHWISSGSANGFWRLAVGNRGTIVRIYKDNNLWTP
ncbi:MAG: hypothetical protein JNL32_14790 [Candidatus Kapabacteria bacterium]|nr:hypothetical protein [Candidatus Kapabacteria bacterium]